VNERSDFFGRQTVLPFKLEATGDTITAPAGLVVFGEFLHSLNLAKEIDRMFGKPGIRKAPSLYPSCEDRFKNQFRFLGTGNRFAFSSLRDKIFLQ
jgi:hypothetical protein